MARIFKLAVSCICMLSYVNRCRPIDFNLTTLLTKAIFDRRQPIYALCVKGTQKWTSLYGHFPRGGKKLMSDLVRLFQKRIIDFLIQYI
jgi:hypothetical protein